jgi:hypothetical protein
MLILLNYMLLKIYIFLKAYKMHTLQMLALTCLGGKKTKLDKEILCVASCLSKQDSQCANVRCLKPFTITNLLLAVESCGRQSQAI